MLGELERKLTALVGDLLAQRTDVKVLTAADPSTPGTGEGTVHVALSDLSACAVFEHGQFAAAGTGNSPARRRIQPLQFAARLEFNRNPQGSSPAARSTARGRLLDDLSLVSHGLGTLALRTGAVFATDNPDPGFRVVAFELESGVTAVTPAGSAANPLAAAAYLPGTGGDLAAGRDRA